MNNKSLIGKLGLLLTAIIWGSGFTFSAIALQYFTTFQVIALRFGIAFIILLILNLKKLKGGFYNQLSHR
ncbi:EamA family transporter [Ignavigranum ruoffiae]|uniref:EamA family transporter n=1 Tax=Ignavigranum ruoffiae TaxID=89093 RepID=UPI003AFF6DC4